MNLRNWKWFEYFSFFVIIPSIIISIYPFSRNFALNFNVPNLINIFMSNYAHSSLEHLIGNLFFYFLVMFAIFNFETNKKRFYIASAIAFAFIPFILFTITKIIIKAYSLTLPQSLGFSGIVAFLIGYFTYVFYRYLKNIFISINITFLMLLFVANVLYWSIVSKLVKIFILAVASTILLVCGNKEIFKEVFMKISNTINSRKRLTKSYNIFVWMLAILLLFSLITLLPQNIGNINIMAHYVGYIFGLFSLASVEIYKHIVNWLKNYK